MRLDSRDMSTATLMHMYMVRLIRLSHRRREASGR